MCRISGQQRKIIAKSIAITNARSLVVLKDTVTHHQNDLEVSRIQ